MKKKHIILVAVVGFLLLVYGINVFNMRTRPRPADTPETATQSVQRPAVTARTVADMIDQSCAQVWPGHYSTLLDEPGGLFIVNVWQDDIDRDCIRNLRDGQNVAIWNNMVDDLISTQKTMQQSFAELGFEDITVVLSLLDPVEPDTTYLTIANGIAGYDVVNGIDLLNGQG